MAQTNYTPISLYYSTTASAVPTAANLVPGELAINTNDGKLYYEDSSGVVQVLATKSTGSIGGSNTQVQFNNSGSLGGSSSFTWDGTTVTATKFAGALNGTVGATTASTGAFTTLSTSSTTTFSGLTASTALALDASKNVVSVTNTGTGNNVLSASPTLTGTIAGASLSLSSLTSGRVTFAGASGLLSDSANLQFNGTKLGINKTPSAGTPQLLQIKQPDAVYSGISIEKSDDDSYLGIGYWSSTSAWTFQPTYQSTGSYLPIAFATSGIERLRLDTSGNLGLGVTPSVNTVSGSGYRQIEVGTTAGNMIFAGGNEMLVLQNVIYNSGFKYVVSTLASQYRQNGGRHEFYTAPSGTAGNAVSFTQAMTLDASGNLLVGTTSGSGSRLDVVGGGVSVTASGTLYNLLNLKDSVDQSGATFVQFLNSTGGNIGNITRVTTTNAVTYNTTSDYRLKTVTGTVTGQGERIDALKPIDYQWKEGNQQTRGFLAHEFQTVYPNSVSGDKDAVDADGKPIYQVMQASTAEVIADLVAEIQSLRQRIATLENK